MFFIPMHPTNISTPTNNRRHNNKQGETNMSKIIKIVKAKCGHCKKEIIAPEESFNKAWENHINNCDEYKSFIAKITDMDNKKILQPYLKILRMEGLEKELKKILRKWHCSPEELVKILEDMEAGG